MSNTPESEAARRVRGHLNAAFDWTPEARVKAFVSPKATKSPLIDNLPQQRAPVPVGTVGRLTPTRHEQGILRRAAQPGAFILITMREGEPPLYTFEDGSPVLSDKWGRDGKRRPLTEREFARLRQFLVADNDSFFPNGPPQRFTARRVP